MDALTTPGPPVDDGRDDDGLHRCFCGNAFDNPTWLAVHQRTAHLPEEPMTQSRSSDATWQKTVADQQRTAQQQADARRDQNRRG